MASISNDQDSVMPKETPIASTSAQDSASTKRSAEEELDAGEALKKAKADYGLVKTGDDARAEEAATSAAALVPAAAPAPASPVKESEPADAVEVATEEHDDEDEGEAEAGGEADSDEDDEDLDEDELAGLKADQGDDAAAEEPVAEPAAEEGRRRPTRGKRLDYAKLAQEQGGDDDDDE